MDDNCPLVANPDQVDSDSDGIGDVCEMSSLASELKHSYSIYPNPAKSQVRIIGLGNHVKTIRVISIYGKLVSIIDSSEISSDNIIIDMESYNPGFYIIQMVLSDNSFVVDHITKS